MEQHIYQDKNSMGTAAAASAAATIADAVRERGEANIIVATGASQFEMLGSLVRADIDWSKVTAFHLDEYIGLPDTHPASFRKYLKERFVEKLPSLREFHYVDGTASDPLAECKRLGELIASVTIDVACIGIGENGHIAFNDPPADFDTAEAYIVVTLDDLCRKQQFGEGWFPTLKDVPTEAISMSIRQIMKAGSIVCTVPDKRKALAVRRALGDTISCLVPATILQKHPDCRLFLDAQAASLLEDPL